MLTGKLHYKYQIMKIKNNQSNTIMSLWNTFQHNNIKLSNPV